MWSHATWKVDSPNVSTRNNLKLRNVNVYKQSRQVIDFETTINRCFTFPIKWILVACCLHGRPCKASNQKTTRKSKPATFSNNLLHIMWKICAQGWQTWTFTHGYHEIHSCQKPINANNKLEDGPHMYLKVLEPKWNRKRSRWEGSLRFFFATLIFMMFPSFCRSLRYSLFSISLLLVMN